MADSSSAASVVERVADWICALRWEDIPERVRERSRLQTASMLGALCSGASNAAASAVRRAVIQWNRPGPCTVIPTGERLTLHDAVLVNAAHAMALDYDDYLYMGHTGHSAVLASWAIAEAAGLSTREMLVAQVIANEIGGRVGASTVLGPQNGQAWSFIHAVEGAAVASKLWGLDRARTAHALAIALYQPPFTLWPGFMGPGSKVLTAGAPTVAGLQAASFAREGLTGAREIFESPRKGFWAAFTWAPLPHMLGGLGQSWVSDTLAFKRYPGCAYIDTTLDALLDVLDQFERKKGRRLAPEEVRSITVEASLPSVEMDNISSEHIDASDRLSPINVNFSIPFNVAIAVVAGRHDGSTLEQAFLDANEAAIRALLPKIRLSHDWGMTLEVLRAFDAALGDNGVARSLSPRHYLAILAGYRRQLGGRKKTPVRPEALLGQWRSLLRLARAARRAARRERPASAPDLGAVDFTRFRMAFPAKVTLKTSDLEQLSARQDVPWGAPGQERLTETAEDKLLREAGRRLSRPRAEELLGLLRRFDQIELGELTAACIDRS